VYARLGRERKAGDGVGRDEVIALVRRYIRDHKDVLGIDDSQLEEAGKGGEGAPDLWQVAFTQRFGTVPVRHGRISATINSGNLVLIGTEAWGNVRGVSTKPRLSSEEALAYGFAHAGGRSSLDVIVQEPKLEIIPMATANAPVG
jgi:hypothetical protein